MMDTDFHCQRLGALRQDRGNFDQQWEEAASIICPADRNAFTGQGMQLGTQGQKKSELQYDSTTAFAAQRFMSIIESLVTPQGSMWHPLKVLHDDVLARNRQVRIFFDKLAQRLYDYRYRPTANFVGNSQQVYFGLGAYGNGSLYVDKPDEGRGLRYRSIHLGESYFVQNHANIVDTMYRAYRQTARQIVQKWPDTTPAEIKEKAQSPAQGDTLYEILHCVYPRAEYDPERLDGKGRKFASKYILVATKTELEEDGYFTFPYAVARYTQANNETYGRGPAQWVLGAIKTLNEQKKTILKQGHRAVDPVLLAYDDGKLGNAQLRAGKMVPGGLNKDGKRMIDTLPVGNIAVGDKMMQMEIDVIQDAFLIRMFQILLETPQMTATEVLERAKEKGWLLAPTAGRLQSEFLGPMIEREIDLLARQGLLPEMPQILVDATVEYKIEYDNPMSRMAKAERAGGFMRALGVAAEYTKMTGDPRPLDHFAMDRAMPAILDINGAPVDWTSTLEEVAALRAERAEAAETQTMVDAAPAAAAIAKTAQKAPA